MTQREISVAKRNLSEYTDRTETFIYGIGQCLTAYWFGGGQRVFYTLYDINCWIKERAVTL